MIVGFVKDESGQFVHKIVKEGEEGKDPNVLYRVPSQFGDYVLTDEEHIAAVKDALLKQMFEAIRDVAKLDEFWIVRRMENGKYSVAWKIDIPQFRGYYTWDEAEELEKRLNECMAHL